VRGKFVQLATEGGFLLLPGDEYRLDFFVTHIHPTVPGMPGTGVLLSDVLDRDPLLACAPASVHTVPQDDDDDDDDDD